MGKQQRYAKVGVLLLLGINVGAYYLFWPRPSGGEISQEKSPRGGAPPPEQSPKAAKPKAFPAAIVQATPAPVPAPAAMEIEAPDEETLRRLLDHIAKEAETSQAPPPIPFNSADDFRTPRPSKAGPVKAVPPASAQRLDREPRPLPPLQAKPLPGRRATPADRSKIAVTAPLAASSLPGPWHLSVVDTAKGKLVHAKLQQGSPPRIVAAFLLTCARVETNAKTHETSAIGGVTASGAGIRGECERLTISLLEARITFADKARITHDGLPNIDWRGDVIEWQWNANTPGPRPNVVPGTLGAPK